MSDINHRRQNRKAVNKRYEVSAYGNGGPSSVDKSEAKMRTGRTDYLDKSMHCWGRTSLLADKRVAASVSNDFTNGHRGMARAVRGAKAYVRTRIRFHEKHALKNLIENNDD